MAELNTLRSLEKELLQWHEDESEEPFAHARDKGGDTYRSSGAFAGHRFTAIHDTDGSIYFTIGDATGREHQDPSHRLVSFAEAVAPTRTIVYDEPPTISFWIRSSDKALTNLAEKSPRTFNATFTTIQRPGALLSPPLFGGVDLTHVVPIRVPTAQLVGLVAKAQGLSDKWADRVALTSGKAAAITSLFATENGDAPVSLSSTVGPMKLVCTVEASAGARFDHTVAVLGGDFLVPTTARWGVDSRYPEPVRGLEVGMVKLSIQLTSSDVDFATEATLRARAMELSLGVSNRDMDLPTESIWQAPRFDGPQTLRLEFEDAPAQVQAEMRDFADQVSVMLDEAASPGIEARSSVGSLAP